jgi:hypothetical protein
MAEVGNFIENKIDPMVTDHQSYLFDGLIFLINMRISRIYLFS